MKAKILELIGKYYGTQVEIDFEDGLEPLIIKIWERGDKPSDRQLSKNVDYFESNHYENDASYNRAMHLVAAVLSLNIIKEGNYICAGMKQGDGTILVGSWSDNNRKNEWVVDLNKNEWMVDLKELEESGNNEAEMMAIKHLELKTRGLK